MGVSFGSAVVASADISGTCGDNLFWTLDNANTLTITGTGAMTDYWNYTSSFVPWANYKADIKTVTIENGVTSIGMNAFNQCSNLENVTIPGSVTSIGESAFHSCTSLKIITIPYGVTSINSSAFNSCSNLKSIFLPERLTSIGTDAIPTSATQIKYTVDGDNVTVTEVTLGGGQSSFTIPDTINGKTVTAVYIKDGATGVTIPTSATQIKYTVYANGNVTITGVTLGSSQTSVVIPEKIGGKTVTAIGDYAFGNCSSLTSITIPDSVVSIENYAFGNCASLESVSFGENPQLTSIGDNAFVRCSNLKSIKFPESVQSIGIEAFSSCGSLESVTIPKNVSSIGPEAFASCSSINVDENNPNYSSENGVLFDKNKTKLIRYPANRSGNSYVIPDSVKLIDEYAFAACGDLTSVTIPEGVTSIGDLAFSHCLSLKSITIPNSVNSIGNYAFTDESDYGYYIESIFLPNSLTSIGTDAIKGFTTKVRYTVDDEGNAAIVNIELGTEQTKVDIPEMIGEYPVIDAAEEYQQYVGEHTHTGGSATCTEKPVCSICGNTYGEVDPDNHSFTSYASNKDATCTENGTETAKCDRCDKTDTREEVGSALGHDHSGDWLNDTANHWKVCTRDGCTEILDKANHDFDKGVVTTEPTEDAEGVRTYTCETCGYKKTESIPAVESSDPVESFVERLYRSILNRDGDEHKKDHIANLQNSKTACQVAYDFVFSTEFMEQPLSNEDRVKRMYLAFLGREADPEGLASWTAILDNGCSIGHIFYGFAQSPEFGNLCKENGITQGTWEFTESRDRNPKLTAFVSRLYTKALNRPYDVDGLNNHTANYLAGGNLYKMAYDFIFSEEFLKRNLSDEDFVDTMYHTFFDREGDPDGRADWLGKLKNGCSREEVLAGFVYSQECADMVAKFGI